MVVVVAVGAGAVAGEAEAAVERACLLCFLFFLLSLRFGRLMAFVDEMMR